MPGVAHYMICLATCFLHCNAFEPITTGAGLVAAGSVIWMAKDKVMCQFRECCEEPYIKDYPFGLEQILDENLYGQHIAKSVVLKTLQARLRKREQKKALVLSFHGMTGSGKNYVSQLIAENLFKEGMRSKYVHVYVSKVHFPEKNKVDIYKRQIQQEIEGHVKRCARSLIIFDEIDDLDPGIIDAIKPFLDYYPNINGVDYRHAIFIFLSNSGASKIYGITLDHWKRGEKRETLSLEDYEEALSSAAYNNNGGLWRTEIIEKALIDASIPFLPLEKEHVKLCIKAEITKQNNREKKEEGEERTPAKEFTDQDLVQLAEKRTYDQEGVFSKMGCKKLETLVASFMEED